MLLGFLGRTGLLGFVVPAISGFLGLIRLILKVSGVLGLGA